MEQSTSVCLEEEGKPRVICDPFLFTLRQVLKSLPEYPQGPVSLSLTIIPLLYRLRLMLRDTKCFSRIIRDNLNLSLASATACPDTQSIHLSITNRDEWQESMVCGMFLFGKRKTKHSILGKFSSILQNYKRKFTARSKPWQHLCCLCGISVSKQRKRLGAATFRSA